MFRILLIRPGTTDYDQQGRIQGTLDIPLCEEGRREVDAAVESLRDQPLDAIYASPSQSAKQTADALGNLLSIKPKTLDKLHNLNQGLWQGMLVDDVKKKQPKVYRQWQEQPETVCPPQGETVSAAKERVQAVVAKLMKKHKSEGVVALVVPEPLASVVLNVLRHDGLGDLWQRKPEAGSWVVLDVLPQAVGAE
jgi:broad specificity phosphatase PhoE